MTEPAAPQTPTYPPQPATPSKKNFWSTPGGVLTIIGIVVAGLWAIGTVSNRIAADKLDVQITSCNFTSGSLPSATVGLSVKNNGDSTHTARIRLEYRDVSGARIDTDTAVVRNIAPGDTVKTEEITLLDAPASAGRCVVTGVS